MPKTMDYQATMRHLGGQSKLEAMIGAKNFLRCGEEAELQFAIGRGARNGCNRVTIGLQRDDLYFITLWKLRNLTITELENITNVHAENLRTRLSQALNMDLTL